MGGDISIIKRVLLFAGMVLFSLVLAVAIYFGGLFVLGRFGVDPSNDGLSARDKAVEEFLLSQQEFAWGSDTGAKHFCVYENLDSAKQLFPIYLWVRCGEWGIKDGKLYEYSGVSEPVKINYPNELSFYDIKKFTFEIPDSGSLYDKSIKRIFPEYIWPALNHDGTALNNAIRSKAGGYFEVK